MKHHIICSLLGHVPRGPVLDNPVVYCCERCKLYIRFDSERGWYVWKNAEYFPRSLFKD